MAQIPISKLNHFQYKSDKNENPYFGNNKD